MGMGGGMQADFMSPFGDLGRHLRIIFEPNIDQEEGAFNPIFIKGIEDIFSMFCSPAGIKADGY